MRFRLPSWITAKDDKTRADELRPRWIWEPWRPDLFFGYVGPLEAMLVFVRAQYVCLMVIGLFSEQPYPGIILDNPITITALTCLIALSATTSFAGMMMNVHGERSFSKYFRVIGAIVGMMVWIFLLSKNLLVGVWFSFANPWFLAGILSSMWIIRRGILGFPRAELMYISEAAKAEPG